MKGSAAAPGAQLGQDAEDFHTGKVREESLPVRFFMSLHRITDINSFAM